MELELNRECTDGPLRRLLDHGVPGARSDRGGLQVHVRRFWREPAGWFVRMEPPLQDLEAVWAGEMGPDGECLVLEGEPYDLDDERYVQYVLRPDIVGAVRTIDGMELKRIEPALRAAARARSTLDVDRLSRWLGSPLERDSPEWYRGGADDRGLSAGLHVQRSVIPPGTRVPVQRIERRADDLLLCLESPRHPDSKEEFRVVARSTHGGREFAVLVPREPAVRPIDPGAAYLVEVFRGAVGVLDPADFVAPARALVEGLEPTRGRFFARLGRLYYKDREVLEPLLSARVPSIDAGGGGGHRGHPRE